MDEKHSIPGADIHGEETGSIEYRYPTKKYKEGKYVEVIKTIEKTKEKIRKMRSSGLARGGEFSTENLVFKVLRRTDLLGKMNDLITKSTDKKLSETKKM